MLLLELSCATRGQRDITQSLGSLDAKHFCVVTATNTVFTTVSADINFDIDVDGDDTINMSVTTIHK